jgi:6-pyruvoyltetrahydropterin/6-carboxytetrahydropterin synthase
MERSIRHFVHTRKEALKFSAAHMTVFPDGTKEALHGHNYSTEVEWELSSISLSEMLSFAAVKSALREICENWDEKVLLAELCPFFKKQSGNGSLSFTLCQKAYLLPLEEVELLPIENVTCENLAALMLRLLLEKLEPREDFKPVLSLAITVNESPGQGARAEWRRTR